LDLRAPRVRSFALRRSFALGPQHVECADNQRVDAGFDIGLPVEQLDVDRHALALIADHAGRKIPLVRQIVAPAIGQLLLELIREYAVGTVTYDGDMRQLPHRQRKDLSTAEHGIASQQHDGSGELYAALRLDVPGLEV